MRDAPEAVIWAGASSAAIPVAAPDNVIVPAPRHETVYWTPSATVTVWLTGLKGSANRLVASRSTSNCFLPWVQSKRGWLIPAV